MGVGVTIRVEGIRQSWRVSEDGSRSYHPSKGYPPILEVSTHCDMHVLLVVVIYCLCVTFLLSYA